MICLPSVFAGSIGRWGDRLALDDRDAKMSKMVVPKDLSPNFGPVSTAWSVRSKLSRLKAPWGGLVWHGRRTRGGLRDEDQERSVEPRRNFGTLENLEVRFVQDRLPGCPTLNPHIVWNPIRTKCRVPRMHGHLDESSEGEGFKRNRVASWADRRCCVAPGSAEAEVRRRPSPPRVRQRLR